MFHCFAGFSSESLTQNEFNSKLTEIIKLEGKTEVSRDKDAERTVTSFATCSGAVITSHEAGMRD